VRFARQPPQCRRASSTPRTHPLRDRPTRGQRRGPAAESRCASSFRRRRAAPPDRPFHHANLSRERRRRPVKSKDVKKMATKAMKNGKEIAEDLYEKAVDAAEPAMKAIAKAAKPKVKALKKAAAPRVKAMKKAAAKAAGKIKDEARGMAKDALKAGSKKLKKAAKAI